MNDSASRIAAAILTLTTGSAFSQTVSNDAGSVLEEIVVTAQKREESLQNVAAAVDVFTEKRLATSGVVNIQALQGLAPGVHIQAQSNSSFIYVRGVGSATLIGDPSVPMFIDGVYTGRGTAASGLFYDLARVEVLKGPQGTLYGRNATAGAVNLVSNRPEDGFSASAQAGYASFSRFSAQGMLNTPVTDTLKVRAAFQRVQDDGYMSNGGSDLDDLAARVSSLYDGGGTFTALLIGDYYKREGAGPSTMPVYSQDPACSGGRFCRPDDPWFTPEKPSSVDTTNWGVLTELNWDLGFAELTLNPSYRVTRSDRLGYNNALVNGSTFIIDTDQTSFEARLVSAGTPFKWIAGANYHHEDTQFDQVIRGVGAGPGRVLDAYTHVSSNETKAYAAFAEGTYPLASRLRATLGLRYTKEEKTQAGQGWVAFTTAPAPIPLNTPLNPFDLSGELDNSKTTWKAGFEFDVSPASLLYVNAGTGFKSGGINREREPNTFAAETILAYALGSKNTFFDNRLLLNAEAFYWKYDERQNDQLAPLRSNPPPNQAQDIRTFNLGETRIYGLDLTAAVQITRSDRLELGVEYLNSKYQDDPANNFPATVSVPAPGVVLVIEPGADLRDKTLAFSPEWAGNIALEHTFALGTAGTLDARIESQLQTESYTQYRLAQQSLQPSYTKSSFTLTYRTADEKYSVSGYVRNIEDEPVIRSTSVASLASTQPRYYGYIEEPRNYGIELRAKF